MSCLRKSENGLNAKFPGTRMRSLAAASMATGAGFAGVRNVVRTWQPAQPVLVNSGSPRLIAIGSLKSRGVGASAVMNTVNRKTSSWISVRLPAQDADGVVDLCPLRRGQAARVRSPVWRGARSSQPSRKLPAGALGAFSSANVLTDAPRKQLCVVIAISLLYASAENCVSDGTPAFQPKRPTRVDSRLCVGIARVGQEHRHAVDDAADRRRLRRRQPVEERVGDRVDQAQPEQRRA